MGLITAPQDWLHHLTEMNGLFSSRPSSAMVTCAMWSLDHFHLYPWYLPIAPLLQSKITNTLFELQQTILRHLSFKWQEVFSQSQSTASRIHRGVKFFFTACLVVLLQSADPSETWGFHPPSRTRTTLSIDQLTLRTKLQPRCTLMSLFFPQLLPLWQLESPLILEAPKTRKA